jgi:hypothetical protein
MHDLIQLAGGLLDPVSDGLVSLKSYISDEFGTGGLFASAILGVVTIVLIVRSLLKILFNILRYVILPSIVLSFLAGYLLQVSYSFSLPASVSLCVLVLLFKH